MKQYLTRQQVIAYRRRVLKEAEEKGVTAAARVFGIHRDTIYAWRAEILPQKPEPKGKAYWQTNEVVEDLILQIRFSRAYGPKRMKTKLSDFGYIDLLGI